MDLSTNQQHAVTVLNKLITDKYEELIWNELYYPENDNPISHLLHGLQSEGVEVNFTVNVKPYTVS